MLRTILILTVISFTTGLFASNPIDKYNNVSDSQINGKVRSLNTQKALSRAQVVIYSENTHLIKAVTTDKKGEFSITNLPAGKYYLSISYLGYKPEIVDNITVNSTGMVVNLENVLLQGAVYEIDEVIVKAERKGPQYLSAVQE